MGYRRRFKVISASAGRPGKDGEMGPAGSAIVITSDTAPATRPDGTPLTEGDFWWDNTESLLHIYIDGVWEEAGGSGDNHIHDTSELPLKNPTLAPEDGEYPAVVISTLPDSSNLSTQEDANKWFYLALAEQDQRLADLEDNTVNSEFTYLGQSPIDVFQQADKVTHFMDMTDLVNIENANPVRDRITARIRKNRRSINRKADDDSFTFEALAPVTVDVQDKDVTHGMLISDLNFLT